MSKLAINGGNPIIDFPLKPYSTIGIEEKNAVMGVMEDRNISQFIGAYCDDFYGGPKIQEFESKWSDIFNIKHSISVNSNTSGLIVAMGAIGLSPGDEVILPPWTMSATAMAPLIYGGIPIFVDIESDYYCISYDSVIEKINKKTKAIIAVNLFGHPAELQKLRKLADQRGIYLIEDNAQSILGFENDVYTGTIGHIGVFSLNYHKHINTGEGGICTTNDTNLANRMMLIRNHGENSIYELNQGDDIVNLIGQNYRLTEMQAAIGLEQLKKLPDIVNRRVFLADQLTESLIGLKGIKGPALRSGCKNVYYVWVGKIDENYLGISRENYLKALEAEGIPISGGYVEPLYKLPCFQQKIAIGNNHFPFNLTNVDYSNLSLSVVESLYQKHMIEFQICSYQLDADEMNLIIDGFHKIHENIDEIRNLDK